MNKKNEGCLVEQREWVEEAFSSQSRPIPSEWCWRNWIPHIFLFISLFVPAVVGTWCLVKMNSFFILFFLLWDYNQIVLSPKRKEKEKGVRIFFHGLEWEMVGFAKCQYCWPEREEGCAINQPSCVESEDCLKGHVSFENDAQCLVKRSSGNPQRSGAINSQKFLILENTLSGDSTKKLQNHS